MYFSTNESNNEESENLELKTKGINVNLSKYQLVKNKMNIALYRNKTETDSYFIHFEIKNDKYDLKQLVLTSIISMLKEFNKDLVEDFIIEENKTSNDGTMFLLLKSPNKDMGISNKFIKGDFKVEQNDSIIYFSSVSSSETSCKSHSERAFETITIDNKKYDEITLKFFQAVIDCRNKHSCVFTMHFNIDIHEDLPIYMQNMRGMMIAKICYNLKSFIEKM